MQAGTGTSEGVSSKLWLYRSLLDQAADNNAGLIGPIIVTAAGKALPDGRPDDVDTEFVTLFEVPLLHLSHPNCDPGRAQSLQSHVCPAEMIVSIPRIYSKPYVNAHTSRCRPSPPSISSDSSICC